MARRQHRLPQRGGDDTATHTQKRLRQQKYKNIPEGKRSMPRTRAAQASMQRKLTSERLEGEEAATMLFPSHHQAVRVQSSDAQTRLDRQLYTSTAANPSFEFCISQHEAAMQFSFQPAPTKPHGPHVGVSQSGAKAICQNRNTPAQTSPTVPMWV